MIGKNVLLPGCAAGTLVRSHGKGGMVPLYACMGSAPHSLPQRPGHTFMMATNCRLRCWRWSNGP